MPKLVQVTSVSSSIWCQLPELANAMLGGRCLDLPNSGPTFQGGRYDRVIVVVSTALPLASKNAVSHFCLFLLFPFSFTEESIKLETVCLNVLS